MTKLHRSYDNGHIIQLYIIICPTYYYYFSFPQTTFIAPSTYMYFTNIKAHCMLFEYIRSNTNKWGKTRKMFKDMAKVWGVFLWKVR